MANKLNKLPMNSTDEIKVQNESLIIEQKITINSISILFKVKNIYAK